MIEQIKLFSLKEHNLEKLNNISLFQKEDLYNIKYFFIIFQLSFWKNILKRNINIFIFAFLLLFFNNIFFTVNNFLFIMILNYFFLLNNIFMDKNVSKCIFKLKMIIWF